MPFELLARVSAGYWRVCTVACDNHSKVAEVLLCTATLWRSITGFSGMSSSLGRLVMPTSVVAAIAAVPWLLGTVVCAFLAIYALAVLVALLHPDEKRRADARAVLRLHIQALWPKRR